VTPRGGRFSRAALRETRNLLVESLIFSPDLESEQWPPRTPVIPPWWPRWIADRPKPGSGFDQADSPIVHARQRETSGGGGS